ncbi:fibrous sheath CABYR-binding protein-like [Chanos chanos]|uniref:Fibrous sheath CABYR-binding protein-like n=1 Tax=Chanos chanos TaxID=29144 RepID=A0A6J2WJF5_CHACN|nr:fibrous sheath CABYR-binding protein-like [Chanos chanos]
MSDHSTSSSASSTNSWTILSPEVGAVDALGPGDDGTESLSDAPSLSEDLAGMSVDARLREHELPVETVLSEELPVETVLSEEGHQVCQETSPDIYEEGPSASAQAVLTSDPEIRPPVIHDTITSSPPDNDDLLGATPFAITESALLLTEEPALSQPLTEELAGSPAPDSLVHQSPAPESLIHQSPGPEATIEESSSPESHAPEVTTEVTSLPAHQVSAEESSVVQSPAPEITAEESSPPESPTAEASAEGNSFPQSPAPEVMTDINPAPES